MLPWPNFVNLHKWNVKLVHVSWSFSSLGLLLYDWYTSVHCKLWVRSVNPQTLPILRTNMIMVSLWRMTKHKFLKNYNHPRLDLVIFTLISQLILHVVEKVNCILIKNYRMHLASWGKEVKRGWKCLKSKILVMDTRILHLIIRILQNGCNLVANCC